MVAIACVGAVIEDETGRLLVVQRQHDPGAGLWSIPGGRVEPGESDAEALVREVREETGLDCVVGDLLGRVRRGHYAIADYAVRVTGGTLCAGDDAVEVRWCTRDELRALPLVPLLLESLREFGLTDC